MSDRPVLELLAGRAAPVGFEDLAAELARLAEPIAGPIAPARAAATLAASPTAPGIDAALASGRPVAIWSDDGPVDRRAACRIASAPVPADEPNVITLSPHRLDLDGHPACMPFVRSRARRARGLPGVLVVDTALLDGDDEVRVALDYASVVVAPLCWAPVALARGVPLVTDADAAAALGAEPGVELVTAADERGRAAAATDLAGDERRSASIARAGRRFAERALDARRSATLVARALGLHADAATTNPRRLIADRVRELRSAPT